MPLVVRRRSDETWREAVIRIASLWGLRAECLEFYDADIERGVAPEKAAFCALLEWDCCEYEEEEGSDATDAEGSC
jgi:hypothetical protein